MQLNLPNISNTEIAKPVQRSITAADGHVDITISIALEWMPIGYNVTATITGVYNETSIVWNGTATLNMSTATDGNATDQTYYPYSLIDGNFTLDVTAITNPDDPGFTDFEVMAYDWCVWDKLTASQIAYYWETNADNETDQSWLVWVSGVWYWAQNGTTYLADTNQKINLYVNGTSTEGDSAYVDAYKQIVDLWAGPYDSTDIVTLITVNATDISVGGTNYTCVVWNKTLTVELNLDYNLTESFVDAGAAAYIANRLGERNVIELVVYDGTLINYDHAPTGIAVYLKLNSSTYSAGYEITRTTNWNGFVYWLVNQSMITNLGDEECVLWYHTGSNPYTVVQNFTSFSFAFDGITGEATQAGIHIRVSFTLPTEATQESKGEYEYIVGLEDIYYYEIAANSSTESWTSVGMGNLRDIYLPDIIDERVMFNITVVQSLDADWLIGSAFETINLDPTLEITERQLFLTDNIVGLSGTVTAEANYTIEETTVAGGTYTAGTGTITAGSFYIEWDRATNTDIGSANFTVVFDHRTQETNVSGSYALAAPTIGITVEGVSIGDSSLTVTGTTWRDFEWWIYDEGVYTSETGSCEPMSFSFNFDKNTTVGLHNYSIYFNATVNGVEYYRWYNSSYTYAFSLSIDPPEVRDTSIEVRGTTNVAANYYVYVEGVYGGAGYTGSLTPTTFSFFFDKETVTGLHNYSIYFNVSATVYVWKNGSYYVSGLVVSDTLYTYSTDYNFLSGVVSLDCYYTVFENDTIVGPTAISAGSFAISWARNISLGYYEWAVKFNDTVTTRWVNGSYQIVGTFTVSNVVITGDSVVVNIHCLPSATGNYYIFENSTYINETGSFTVNEELRIVWEKNAGGLWYWEVVCNISTGDTYSIYGAYYKAAETVTPVDEESTTIFSGVDETLTTWAECFTADTDDFDCANQYASSNLLMENNTNIAYGLMGTPEWRAYAFSGGYTSDYSGASGIDVIELWASGTALGSATAAFAYYTSVGLIATSNHALYFRFKLEVAADLRFGLYDGAAHYSSYVSYAADTWYTISYPDITQLTSGTVSRIILQWYWTGFGAINHSLIVDYLYITPTYMNEDLVGYHNSYASADMISVTNCTVSTDYDILTVTENGAGTTARYYHQFTAFDYQYYYYEVYVTDVDSGAEWKLQYYSGTTWYDLTGLTDSKGLFRGIINASTASTLSCIGIYFTGDGLFIKLDYLMISDVDEMGWRRNGDDVRGIVASDGGTAIASGGYVTLTADADGSTFTFYFDSTGTAAGISSEFYSMLRLIWDETASSGTATFYAVGSSTYIFAIVTLSSNGIDEFVFGQEKGINDYNGEIIQYFYIVLSADAVLKFSDIHCYTLAYFTVELSTFVDYYDAFVYNATSGCLETWGDNVYVFTYDKPVVVDGTRYNMFDFDGQFDVIFGWNGEWPTAAENTLTDFGMYSDGLWHTVYNTQRGNSYQGTITKVRFSGAYVSFSELTFITALTTPIITIVTSTPVAPTSNDAVVLNCTFSGTNLYGGLITIQLYPVGWTQPETYLVATFYVGSGTAFYNFTSLEAGEYQLTFIITDGIHEDETTISFTVGNANIEITDWSHGTEGANYYQVVGFANWPCNAYVYENDTLVYGPVAIPASPTSFSIIWLKNTLDDARVNWTIKFNATDLNDGWLLGIYINAVNDLYSTSFISLYGPDAIGLDPLMFKVYVNDTRVWSLIPQFYNRTDYVYNITILNFLNETISSTTCSWARFIDVSLDVYTLFVYNQLEEEFIYFNVTSTAGATWRGYVPPRGYINIAIYASTNYTYAFTVLQGGKGGTFGGIVNIDADFGIIINAYNLMDIFRGIQEVGGGSMTTADLTNALMSVYGGPMGQIQFFSWISAILIFIGLYAVPFVRSRSKKEGGGEIDVAEIMRTGGYSTVKQKGETPKQLKPYEFPKGPLNPNYKGKGAGMDDMSKFVWGRLKGSKKSGGK